MVKSKRSLGGAERRVAPAGVGSSPTASTLRKRLRKLDRKITELKKHTRFWWRVTASTRWELEELDRKRKEVREQLKAKGKPR